MKGQLRSDIGCT